MAQFNRSTDDQIRDMGPSRRDENPLVFLVDDDEQLLSANTRILANEGYRVETAKDAETALVALRRKPFDVLVSDIVMPHVGGIELLARIRGDGNNIPVILLTAEPRLDTAIGALEKGVIRYLEKPLQPGELVRVVGHALRLHGIVSNRLTLDSSTMGTLIQELKTAKIAAETARRTTGEFLAKMSYELRAPVHTIMRMTELVLDTELTTEQREYLATVLVSTAALRGIILDTCAPPARVDAIAIVLADLLGAAELRGGPASPGDERARSSSLRQ